MIARMTSLFSRAFRAPAALAAGCLAAVSLVACNKNESPVPASHSTAQSTSSPRPGSLSMCTLMPKEDVNAAIGSSYTIAEASDGRSESSCHYSSELDPAGLSLDLRWIEPSDYSSPAEHAALQAAGMGGARIGGKLTESVVPNANAPDGGPLHIRSGPVEGVGDEATQNMLLLTARKGDYLLMIQIVADPMKLMQDSTAGPQVLENERKLARSVFAKV
jgi:hypothetical protein